MKPFTYIINYGAANESSASYANPFATSETILFDDVNPQLANAQCDAILIFFAPYAKILK